MLHTNEFPNLDMDYKFPARCNFQLRQIIGKTLYFIPGARFLLRVISSVVLHLNNIDKAYRDTRHYIDKLSKGSPQDKEAQSFDSGFGYDSEFAELGYAEYYRQQILKGNLVSQKTESGILYNAVVPMIGSIIEQSSIMNVVDFGVSYGYVDSLIAELYPSVQIIGIDRSVLTKQYNERFFKIPNLEFVAGDIFEYFESHPMRDAICFHMRTLTCLPQSFVERFYDKCAHSGFKRIVGAEVCGISWETGQPYQFSINEKKSVCFRNGMFIHNYPGLLKKAGYSITESRLLKTNHPDPNYRVVIFAAVLNGIQE